MVFNVIKSIKPVTACSDVWQFLVTSLFAVLHRVFSVIFKCGNYGNEELYSQKPVKKSSLILQ
jgi:hypothetical protein